jgi:hypothetical protein
MPNEIFLTKEHVKALRELREDLRQELLNHDESCSPENCTMYGSLGEVRLQGEALDILVPENSDHRIIHWICECGRKTREEFCARCSNARFDLRRKGEWINDPKHENGGFTAQ